MGKIENLTILFNKDVPIYFPGESVSGKVNVRVKESLKINDLKLTMKGSAKTHWTEHQNNGKETHTVYYSLYEVYFKQVISLMNKQIGQELTLNVGEYSFPFNLILPSVLPTSFQHKYGRIRYMIKADIDIPWALDKHSERQFTVISNLDLNQNPAYRQPFTASETKILGFGPFKSDPIIGTITIPKSGFVPGENINFTVSIENNSSRDVKEMTVSLIQVINFRGKSLMFTKTKHEKRNVALKKYPGRVNEKSSEKWTDSIVVPPVASSINQTCSIIDVNYVLLLNFDMSGIATSKDVKIPITIGTIPIINHQSNSNYYSGGASNFSYQSPPPSYQACMFGANQAPTLDPSEQKKKGEVYESDLKTYSPIYPYYNNIS